MKHGIFGVKPLAVVLIVMLLSTVALYSQNRGSRPSRDSRQPEAISVEERVTELQKELSLTEEQTAEITTLMTTHVEEVTKLHEDSTTDRSEKMEKMKELRESFEEEVMKILDEEQQAKFIEYNKNNRPPRDNDRESRG